MREPKSVDVVIGEDTFTVVAVSAWDALDVAPIVMRGWSKKDDDDNPLERISGAELKQVAKSLLAMSRVNGQELLPMFPLYFAGYIGTVLRLLTVAVNLNFASFPDGSASGQGAGPGSKA